ncbi:MICOS complex subunit MIC27 [Bicyclus anynana]|uniref:MICOS complex subunit n=1 Tax=Bicyclus anynana TaxID=110368 RepID=A0A6J1PA67_BICAN|nr:MICOS complex subunit MIC27 [Bicyclus anynana]XP_023954743.2 MICOS complex subunit MIC27 [Bicyclus anynana]
MIRKIVIGSGMLALVPTIRAATPVQESKEPTRPPPMKPSELPIYEAPHADYAEYLEEKAKENKTSYVRSALLGPVRAVREQVQIGLAHTESATNTIKDNYSELQDRSQWIVQYLREEENKQIRYGAVAMGGLTGFIFGLRGGLIRRIFYAGLGTTGMGYICFPEETKQLMKDNGSLAKQYINIAYNFFYGVKPGDPQLEVKFPDLSFPKDLSEFVDMTVSVATSVKQAVMPPPSKDAGDNKPSEHKE